MADPGLAEGTLFEREAILWLLTTDHRLDRCIGHITAYGSCHRCAGLWYADRCGLWAARRMARYLYQYMAAGATVASV